MMADDYVDMLQQLIVETQDVLKLHQDGIERCVDAWGTKQTQLLRALRPSEASLEIAIPSIAGPKQHQQVCVPQLHIQPHQQLQQQPQPQQLSQPPPQQQQHHQQPVRNISGSSWDLTVCTNSTTSEETKRPPISPDSQVLARVNREGTPNLSEGTARPSIRANTATWSCGPETVPKQQSYSTIVDMWKSSQHPRECLQRFVEAPVFLLFAGMFIFMNAVLVGIETNHIAMHGDTSEAFFALQLCFNAWFLAELLLRIVAWGVGHVYYYGDDRHWNAFDTVLVILSVVDVFSQSTQLGSFAVARMVRAVRLLRLARVMRMLRLMYYFKEFRKILILLGASVQTLLWSLLAILFVVYIFAVLFTQSAADHLGKMDIGSWSTDQQQLKEDFGSVERSIYTLYTAITGGRNWAEVVGGLSEIDEMHVCAFIAFISFSFLGVLNIVTSVFVECAMQSTQRHRDILVEDKKLFEQGRLQHMKAIFQLVDREDSGVVDYQELKSRLGESAPLRDYFRALGLNATDSLTLFELLDTDGSGSVTLDEFCDGFMRLHGEARAFDIHLLMQHCEKQEEKLSDFTKQVFDGFESLNLGVHDLGAFMSAVGTPQSAEQTARWDPSTWEHEAD